MAKHLIGRSDDGSAQELVLRRANRHGLITGATGTGKTVTLQGLAEGFSRAGVPVFLADVKGDLAGIAQAGDAKDCLTRARQGDRRRRLHASPASRRVLGHLRQAGPSGARHDLRDGAAAARAHARSSTTSQEGVLNVAFKSPTTTACCCST